MSINDCNKEEQQRHTEYLNSQLNKCADSYYRNCFQCNKSFYPLSGDLYDFCSDDCANQAFHVLSQKCELEEMDAETALEILANSPYEDVRKIAKLGLQ